MTVNDLPTFKFWCYKVLPLVYDDSLSYYEVLCKVVDYINKLISQDKIFGNELIQLQDDMKVVQEWIKNYDTDYIEQQIKKLSSEIVPPLVVEEVKKLSSNINQVDCSQVLVINTNKFDSQVCQAFDFYDDEHVFVCGRDDSNEGIVALINLKNGTIICKSNKTNYYHMNDICYANDTIYVIAGYSKDNQLQNYIETFTYNNATATIAYNGNINLTGPNEVLAGLGYENGTFYLLYANCWLYKTTDFKTLTFIKDLNQYNVENIGQGITIHNGIIYAISSKQGYYTFNTTGELLAVYQLPLHTQDKYPISEVEGIAFNSRNECIINSNFELDNCSIGKNWFTKDSSCLFAKVYTYRLPERLSGTYTLHVNSDKINLIRDGTENNPYETLNEALYIASTSTYNNVIIDVQKQSKIYPFAVSCSAPIFINLNNNTVGSCSIRTNCTISHGTLQYTENQGSLNKTILRADTSCPTCSLDNIKFADGNPFNYDIITSCLTILNNVTVHKPISNGSTALVVSNSPTMVQYTGNAYLSRPNRINEHINRPHNIQYQYNINKTTQTFTGIEDGSYILITSSRGSGIIRLTPLETEQTTNVFAYVTEDGTGKEFQIKWKLTQDGNFSIKAENPDNISTVTMSFML